MIGINESNSNITQIRDEYIAFVESYLSRVIGFYKEVFNLLKTLKTNRRMSNKVVEQRILEAKQRYKMDRYKYLLKAIIKGNAIKNSGNSSVIRYSDKRHKNANNIDEIIKTLPLLETKIKAILGINFCENNATQNAFYEDCLLKYSCLKFLFPYIFDYDEWYSKLDVAEPLGPYKLTEKLGISSCPYCNRQYIFTITKANGKKVARPQLDHFLPQSINPLLALSFYNLIPSCGVCNSSIKGSKPVSYKTNLNPYAINQLHSAIRFTYYPLTYEASIGMDENLSVEAQYNGDVGNNELKKQVEGNIELFCLNDLYKNHTDTVQEIIKKRSMSNDTYIETLQKTYHSFSLSVEDAYRLAFGNFYNETDFHRRPLSKLTKDIAIELKSLKKFKP